MLETMLKRMLKTIQNSILIPLDHIESGKGIEKIKTISSNKSIYVHCQSGKRSIKAIKLLRKYGIEGINLIGGISAWKN